METVFSVIAAILAIAWSPLVVKFYRSWHNRKNPVSLAICWMIIVVIYSHLLYTLALSFEASFRWVSIIALGFSLTACVNFYVSFYWSKKKFKDERHG